MNPKDIVGAKKSPLGFVPPALVIGTAPAMAVGAEKYGPFNWRERPVQVMTYIEAILRHMYAFMDGQDVAEDTGVSHLGHAAASLGILMDAFSLDRVIDNRPKGGPAADILRSQDKSVQPKVDEAIEAAIEAALTEIGMSPVYEPWGSGDGEVADTRNRPWKARCADPDCVDCKE